ncbi:hypothetical protein K458DRAFT_411072 [Lentithecium fluviatile CBS 122367]|uniref:Heterokaryon incompatibility domain-containing protein n=1 Tax=Lentithecium fluviatile CBS 122367 TaxID=1168545 RepID=A0A6G1ICE6_9PLEO|nr:hypothetical protein K458DRAFT_411072 [Lentithecium fluviatile CBS 122367]
MVQRAPDVVIFLQRNLLVGLPKDMSKEFAERTRTSERISGDVCLSAAALADSMDVRGTRLSEVALIETLWHARARDPHLREPNPFWIDNSFVSKLLRHSGWLSQEIAGLPQDIRFRYYLSFFTQRAAQAQRRASVASLLKGHIKKEIYSAVHVDANCNCTWFGSELPLMHDPEDSFCLISLGDRPGGRFICVHRTSLALSEKRAPFVAFSHVRSDGLGSSTSNSLPECQISLLQKLSDRLLPNERAPIPFYIDTLCVPLNGVAKRNALRNILYLFRFADKVLVLDATLQKTPASLSQESLTRFRYSVWSKRLWTILECAVSREVSFRFRDQNLSLDTMLKSYNSGNEFPLLRAHHLEFEAKQLPHAFFERLSGALTVLSDDMQLAEALRHEETSEEEMENMRSLREGYDRWHLRTVLRLGFLALPQMRYFPEDNESAYLTMVVTAIYAEYSHFRSDEARSLLGKKVDPAALFARLRRIQALTSGLDKGMQ